MCTCTINLLPKIGERGQRGTGGEGGSEAKDGDTFKIGYGRYLFRARVTQRISGKYYQRGNRGRDGANDEDIKQPDVVSFRGPSYSLVGYKNYLNEYLANGIPKSESMNFMANLNNTENIQSLYD